MKPRKVVFRTNGYVEAYTDAYIVNRRYIYMISIYGRQTAVKAIASALLSNRLIDIMDEFNRVIWDDLILVNPKMYARQAEIVEIPELGKVYHQVFAYRGNIIILNTDEYNDGDMTNKGYDKVFSMIDKLTTLPLYEGWKKELCDHLLKTNHLEELYSYGIIEEKPFLLESTFEEELQRFLEVKGVIANTDADVA